MKTFFCVCSSTKIRGKYLRFEMNSVPSKLCARTRINLLRTDILLLRHIVIQHKFTIVSQIIYFSDTNTARFVFLFFFGSFYFGHKNHLTLGENFFFFWSSPYFGHKNHLIIGEDLSFLSSLYFGHENRFGFRTQNSG